jgi:hypothetical protein
MARGVAHVGVARASIGRSLRSSRLSCSRDRTHSACHRRQSRLVDRRTSLRARAPSIGRACGPDSPPAMTRSIPGRLRWGSGPKVQRSALRDRLLQLSLRSSPLWYPARNEHSMSGRTIVRGRALSRGSSVLSQEAPDRYI